MSLKRILMLAPALLVLLLLQAWYWVPGYETQLKSNPARARTFVEGSIGDAKILNPALNADTTSSRITNLVFDGLLDLDRDLNLRGRLAIAWRISETVYIAAPPGTRFADGQSMRAAALADAVRALAEQGGDPKLTDNLQAVRVLDPVTVVHRVSVKPKKGQPREASVRVAMPARVVLDLKRVDQDLMQRLAPLLGNAYGAEVDRAAWISGEDDAAVAVARGMLDTLAPIVEHNPVIDFNLRQGVRFHDGHEFDSGDVKFTYEAIMDRKNLSPRSSDFEPIKRIEILNPYRLRVIYKRLFSPAINAWTMGILPEHLLNRAAMKKEMERRGLGAAARAAFGMRDSEFNRAPVGTGPFQFREWQSDEMIRLARNPDYWEGAPLYENYYYRVIPDVLTQEVEFRTGAMDTYAPQPHQAARYRDDPRYQAFASLNFGYTYIGYNMRRKPFDDERVRRALSQALNVDEMIRYVLYGQGERTTGPFPKNTQWYDHDTPVVPFDPQAALATLQSLGWRRNADGWLEKNGELFEFNLITNNGNLVRKAIMTIAQNSWRKIGVKVNTQLFEWAVFLKDFINPGDFDATILGWSMGVDPDLYQLWHSSQTGPAQLNFVGFADPQADELIERIRREYDVAEQRRLTHRLHRLIAQRQPYTFLYAPLGTRVLDRKIVRLAADNRRLPIEPARSGDVFIDFNRWTKVDISPDY